MIRLPYHFSSMSAQRFTWKIGGEAGFGIVTSGVLFAKMCAAMGRFTADYNEKPNLIRGGHNIHQVTVADEPVFAVSFSVNLLLALNRETVFLHLTELAPGARVIYDDDKAHIAAGELARTDVLLCPVPLMKLTQEAKGDEIMRNTVGIGASLAFMGCAFEPLEDALKKTFGRKPDVCTQNIAAARLGFDYVRAHYADHMVPCILDTKINYDKIVIAGNEAMALGAIQGGCTFYAAYPMSPSSSILHFLAAHDHDTGMVVKHAEDEIAVINMALGASFAGARAMIGTSGGGFALMVESLGLAGIAELPLVIIEVQRPGPATGMPTWTEAADLRFALHAAQGEFPRVVLAPGDVEECFTHTFLAHNLAERWQLPVIMLSDKLLGETNRSIPPFATKGMRVDRGKMMSEKELEKAKQFHRYALTDDGVSPRSIPGQKGGIYLSNSYEHELHGYSDETGEMRIAQADKRMKKLAHLLPEMPKPLLIGEKGASLTFVTWGSTKGPAREAVVRLNEEGMKANMIPFAGIWPFPVKEATELLNAQKHLVLVENNATAQFGGFIREQTGIHIEDKILKYNGRPFFSEEIMATTKGRLN